MIDTSFFMDSRCLSQTSSYLAGDTWTEQWTIFTTEDYEAANMDDPDIRPPHNARNIVLNYLRRYTEVT